MKFLTPFLLIFALAGCAALPTPQSNAQRLVLAEGQVTAVATSATSLYQSGILTDAQRANVLQQLKNANTALDTAWTVVDAGGDPGDTLMVVNRILLGLRAELAKAQGGTQ